MRGEEWENELQARNALGGPSAKTIRWPRECRAGLTMRIAIGPVSFGERESERASVRDSRERERERIPE